MSLLTLLQHRLTAYGRTPFLGRRIASLIVGGMIVLYLGGALAVAGVFFDDLIHAVAPSADPLLLASRGLLPFGLGYAVLQLFLTSGLGVDPTPYRTLPIRRQTLTLLLAVFALMSAWVAVPLVFVGAVCIETALSGAVGTALRFGLACAGLLVTVRYAVPMGQRALSDHPLYTLGALGLGVGALAVEAVPIPLVSLLDASDWLFGGIVQGRLLPSGVGCLVLGGAVAGYRRSLPRALDVDRSGKTEWSVGATRLLDRLARRGPVVREAVLEARLTLRNTVPRFILFAVLLFVATVLFYGFLPLELRDLRDAPPMELFNLTFFPGLFGTGALTVYYGLNLFSWEGHWFEAHVARPTTARHRMEGKVLFLTMGTLFCFLIPLPVLLAQQNAFLLIHGTFALYNAGLLAPATVAAATFNRKALTIDVMHFSQTNFSWVRTAVLIPLVALPLLPLLLFNRLVLQFAPIAVFGLLSGLAFPVWRSVLTALYRRNRHAMLEGFQASRDEH